MMNPTIVEIAEQNNLSSKERATMYAREAENLYSAGQRQRDQKSDFTQAFYSKANALSSMATAFATLALLDAQENKGK